MWWHGGAKLHAPATTFCTRSFIAYNMDNFPWSKTQLLLLSKDNDAYRNRSQHLTYRHGEIFGPSQIDVCWIEEHSTCIACLPTYLPVSCHHVCLTSARIITLANSHRRGYRQGVRSSTPWSCRSCGCQAVSPIREQLTMHLEILTHEISSSTKLWTLSNRCMLDRGTSYLLTCLPMYLPTCFMQPCSTSAQNKTLGNSHRRGDTGVRSSTPWSRRSCSCQAVWPIREQRCI